MPTLRLIKDDPSLHDIIPFPGSLASRMGGRFAGQSTRRLEHEMLGAIDRMQEQLNELSGMLDPIPLYPEDDRPSAA